MCASAAFRVASALGVVLLAGCGALHQWPARSASEGPYVSGNQEFSIELPASEVSFKTGGKEGFTSVDFLATSALGSQELYSVEWTTLPQSRPQSEAEFYEYWEGFLPQYLHGNFGDGNYALLRKERLQVNGAHPALRFVGVGKHNGGSTGSIYGTAVSFGHAMAVVYVLRSNVPKEVPSFSQLPGFEQYERFLATLQCKRPCA